MNRRDLTVDVNAVSVSSCGPFVLRDGLVKLAAPNILGDYAALVLVTE